MVCLLVGLLALAGCSTTQKAGSAAIVGDQRLTESQVADWVDELSTLYENNPSAQRPPDDQLSLAVVSWWLNEQLTNELANQKGVSATQSEVDQLLGSDQQQRDTLSAQNAIPPSQLEAAAEYVVLRKALGSQLAPGASSGKADDAYLAELRKVADDLGVSVNPRFGDWNPELPGLEARDSTRLSSPAAGDQGASPTPSPSQAPAQSPAQSPAPSATPSGQ
jgi:hypothetical protein